jgi:hypothetical protein
MSGHFQLLRHTCQNLTNSTSFYNTLLPRTATKLHHRPNHAKQSEGHILEESSSVDNNFGLIKDSPRVDPVLNFKLPEALLFLPFGSDDEVLGVQVIIHAVCFGASPIVVKDLLGTYICL